MIEYQTVYCHGWSSGPAVWQHITAASANTPSFLDVTRVDGFLDALLASIPKAPHVVIGWSLGGMVALEYAAQQPKGLQALVLIGSTPKFVSEDQDRGWPGATVAQMCDYLETNPLATLSAFQKRMFSSSERQGYKTYRNLFSDHTKVDFGPAALSAGLDYLSEKDLRPSLDFIQCPILWIHGTEDKICPPGCLDILPGAHHVAMLEQAGHVPHWTQPDQVRRLIREFLDGL